MIRVFRALMFGFLGLLLLLILIIALIYWLAVRSLPDYSASFDVEGLLEPLEIVRTSTAVPHVFGSTDRDVFFGLGFAHAQDRLWQMLIQRRSAQGRLSEVFGQRTLRYDDLMRRLNLADLAAESLSYQEESTITALESYSAGVNAWIKEINRRALGRGAPELFLYPSDVSPWRPADSLAILKLVAFQQSEQFQTDILRARLSLTLPQQSVFDIMPDASGPGVIGFSEYSSLFPNLSPNNSDIANRLVKDPISPIARRGFSGASNAWAAAPSRTAGGQSLIANDPHTPFSAPSRWYLARLELSSGAVMGATIPGIPLILSGRSNALGWGVTASFADDQDVLIEKLNPDNAEEVLTPTGYKPLSVRKSIVNIKGASPVTLQLRWSKNGPILPQDQFDLSTITPEGHIASLSWTGLSARDTSMTSGLRLMRAKSIEEGIAAGEAFVAPSYNLLLADAGRIAMKTIGALPNRAANSIGRGRLPAAGWLPQNQWDGYRGYQANPGSMNPASGIIGNTNNKVTDRDFPDQMSYSWGDTQRIARLKTLLEARKVHTRQSFMEIQLDTVSPTARALLPLIASNLWYSEEASPPGTLSSKRKVALDLLANWNGNMNEHLPEPLIYSAWMRALQDRLIKDELGALSIEFTQIEPLFIERVFRDIDGAARWCDVVQSDPQETCDQMASKALDDALQWIEDNYGRDLANLRWGDAHQASQDNLSFGSSPLFGFLTNIRQSTSGGDFTLARGLSKGFGSDPFLNIHGPSYRGIYDFSDPNSSVFILSAGQSGHPLSKFYSDQSELWRRGEYIQMSLDADIARAAAAGVTELSPVRYSEIGLK